MAHCSAAAPTFLHNAASTAGGTARLQSLADTLMGVKIILFDCDGVLWRSSTPVSAAPTMLAAAKAAGFKIAYVTNNSSKPRQAYVDKVNKVLEADGVQPLPAAGDIFSSAYATALQLKRLGLGQGDKVMVVGEPGLAKELEQTAGVTCIGPELSGVPFDMDSTPAAIKEAVQSQPAAAVVVGFDAHLSYTKIAYAASYLRYNAECHFVATNRDLSYPTSSGLLLPGGGTAVQAVEAGSGRLVQTVAGKPSTAFMDLIAEQYGLQRLPDGRWPCLMVGDRLDTDIAFANAAGMSSLLVLSGVTSIDTMKASLEEGTVAPPTFVGDDVGVLTDALELMRQTPAAAASAECPAS